MRGLLIRLLLNAVGIWVASAIIPGIEISGTDTMILAAIILGLVNAFIRPIMLIMTLPFTILTLGLFLLVINAGMLGLVAYLLDDFTISGFFAAFFGAIIVSIVSWWASWFIGPEGNFEVYVMTKKIK